MTDLPFSIIITDDIATCQEIRRVVFIEEQGVSLADEVDGRDGEAVHLLAQVDGRPVGTARMLMAGEVGKIGRVAVLIEHRGAGLGRALILKALETLRSQGMRRAMLGARTDAIGFYEALGFQAIGSEFIDAGIPHREMVLEL